MAFIGLRYPALNHISLRSFPKFVGRTVMVKDNDVESSMRLINRIMSEEGMLKRYRLNLRYEKPYLVRRRLNYEKAKAIYDEDMARKINFVMRKNRVDPWVGST
ncbi:28S ribosomal protein S21, mitochondrial isoform X2 [Hyalella azteca]|nr:28S ribosomal protein S21, mitochondrial isoform X2 [Hyalella azteca]XP_018020871.1 28S ribosomal protein S21, mitochondrial isoform X2 [Hyalella azteca]XP_047736871.1 28S ribosomal protein S21, mitochondrial isoform X2 [Hyalella azteca]